MSEQFSKDFDPDNPFESDEINLSILENLPDDIECNKDIFKEFEIEEIAQENTLTHSVFESETLDKIIMDFQSSKLIYSRLNSKIKANKKDH